MATSSGECSNRQAEAAVEDDDEHGIEHAKRIVKLILHQITEGDAPSCNFNNDTVQNLVSGTITHSSGYLRRQGSSGARRTSLFSKQSNANSVEGQTQSEYGDDGGTSLTREEEEDSDNIISSSAFAATTKLSYRLPPRPPSSTMLQKTDELDVSGSHSSLLRGNANVSSYSIGTRLMGTIPLADLCAWTLQSYTSDSDKEGDNHTPRAHNDGNAGHTVVNVLRDDQGFPILENALQSEDIDRMDSLNTGTSWNSESCTFSFDEDIFQEEGEEEKTHHSITSNGIQSTEEKKHDSTTSNGIQSMDHESKQDYACTTGNTSGQNRMTMFGSEYARILSKSKPASQSSSAHLSASKLMRSSNTVSSKFRSKISSSISLAQSNASSANESVQSAGTMILSLDDCPNSVSTAAITDVIVSSGSDIPPQGYYRAFELGEQTGKNVGPGRKRQRLFLNVKKEPNWDRAVQRPCVTAFCIIHPDRNEFVPPGFSVVRHHRKDAGGNNNSSSKKEKSLSNNTSTLGSSLSPAANINPSGERLFLCYRRSREGNPMTGVMCLRPYQGELIPEGYTVLERTPRNFVANMAADVERPLFLAYRQRLANLECLRPLPLVLSLTQSKVKEMKAYYCTGGTVVSSDVGVGKYHIMDRTTHSLMSTSSAKNRLNLIQSARAESETAVPAWVGLASVHTPSSDNRSLSNTEHSVDESLTSGDHIKIRPFCLLSPGSQGSLISYATSLTSNQSFSHVESVGFSAGTLQKSLDAMHFIPAIECGKTVVRADGATHSDIQSKVAAITPILTSCYTSQGSSSLVAIEGLISMLNKTSFFSQDTSESYDDCNANITFARERLTILDLTVQVVCDLATCSARETYFRACVDFVSDAMRLSEGKLNDRTAGFVLRLYLFTFYFGASVPTNYWPFNKELLQSSADDRLLSDNIEQSIHCGAPQAAAIALKELISLMLTRVGEGLENVQFITSECAGHEDVSPRIHDQTSLLDISVVENYTQLAMYQIHRSGGSELLWYDMKGSIGEGIFGQYSKSNRGSILSFAILACVVKICSGKVRLISNSEPVPRDVASKLLSFELLLHFIQMWHVARDDMKNNEGVNRAPRRQQHGTMIYAIRRLVIPTLLSNTSAAIEDYRVYRRVLRIVTHLWCNPHYRKQMTIDMAVLIEHFVLKALSLGPQVNGSTDKDGSLPSILHHQLDVLDEIKVWYSSNPEDTLYLYICYDTDGMLPPSYCRIMNKMVEALCTLAEQCGVIISEHGRFTSINGDNGSPRRPSPVSLKDTSSSNIRESAQLLRHKSFDVITAIAKSMLDCASVSPHSGLTKAPVINQNDDEDGLRLTPRLSSVPSFTDENIVDYWKTSIEKRRAPLQSMSMSLSSQTETPLPLRIRHSESDDSSHQSQMQRRQETFNVAFDVIAKKGVKKGVDFLIASRLLNPSPRHIAAFLRVHLSSIDSGLLGEYLGEGGVDGADTDFFNLVRFNFARATSFVGMGIEQAIRHYLTCCGFRLPGEAQRIDRIISTFSQCYWEDNAGDVQKCPFQNQDTVFLVSFAMIMLNTDLHKARVSKGKIPKRMTKNEFIANLRGVDEGVDKYQDYISSIYDSIEATPIAISNSLTQNERSTDLASSLQCWVKSVEPAQELLRTFAARHNDFLSESLNDQLLQDTVRQMFSANWHHIHSVVNATIDIAHLDLSGMGLCIDVLEHSLCTATCLGMVVERSAFSKLLDRVNRFHDLKVQNDEGRGERACNESSNQSESEGQFNLEDKKIRRLTKQLKQLHASLSIDDVKLKTMKQVAGRIRNGDVLLNDTSRYFIREGNLVKHHQLAARSSTYRFFLFSDVLVYAHMSKGGDYKVHEELPLHLMKIEDECQTSATKHISFHIHHPNKSFLVTCTNMTEKKEWMDEMNTSIRREIKRKTKIERSRIDAAR